MKIKSLIIDDDPFIRDLLKDKIEQYIDDVEIVGLGTSGEDGLQLIATLQPDLIFLDVEMADMTGFEMLSRIPKINFKTIFITAFNHYAIKAIRFNALDYLVKPIDLGELRTAMTRYRANVQTETPSKKVEHAINNLAVTDPGEEVLTLQLQDQELNLPLKDIIRIVGDRNYSTIITESKGNNLCSKTLGHFEDLLFEKGFFRCHKSHIINAAHVARVKKEGKIVMDDQEELPVSRRKNEAFQTWLTEWKVI
ncbi:MAG: two-component system LytT family response regulator [Flavobacteriales bacterium]|jgi:two-component system LytT family response regulator